MLLDARDAEMWRGDKKVRMGPKKKERMRGERPRKGHKWKECEETASQEEAQVGCEKKGTRWGKNVAGEGRESKYRCISTPGTFSTLRRNHTTRPHSLPYVSPLVDFVGLLIT